MAHLLHTPQLDNDTSRKDSSILRRDLAHAFEMPSRADPPEYYHFSVITTYLPTPPHCVHELSDAESMMPPARPKPRAGL